MCREPRAEHSTGGWGGVHGEITADAGEAPHTAQEAREAEKDKEDLEAGQEDGRQGQHRTDPELPCGMKSAPCGRGTGQGSC